MKPLEVVILSPSLVILSPPVGGRRIFFISFRVNSAKDLCIFTLRVNRAKHPGICKTKGMPRSFVVRQTYGGLLRMTSPGVFQQIPEPATVNCQLSTVN